MDSTRTTKKFQMFQNYLMKYKKLKQNLFQSQNLGKQMKSQLLKLGSECNTLLISVTSITSDITEYKSQLPKRQKQLISIKEDIKRIQYKTQKEQIKQKQYDERAKRFQQMFNIKQTKNLTLKQKIQKLQLKLEEEKQKQKLIKDQLKLVQESNIKQKQNLPFRSYRSSISINPCDQIQLKILTNESLAKKLRQEKQELLRKNLMQKSSINKLQNEVNQVKNFLQNNTSVPYFNQIQKKNTSNKNNKESFTKTDSLPKHIASSLNSFESIKSKTILEPLVQKHKQLIELENIYVQNLQENYLLISELNKINSILESEVVQENSKISAFAIKGQKFAEKHRKYLP